MAGYFAAMNIAMLAGRDINDGDTLDKDPVAIVNETFARQIYPACEQCANHDERQRIIRTDLEQQPAVGSYLPARRGTRVDPVVTSRAE